MSKETIKSMEQDMIDDEVLAFEPFKGDFGTPDDRVFSNKMVITRKEGPCAHCGLLICKGERVRSQSSKFDGEMMSHRWCTLCCTAMANYCAELIDDDRDGLQEYEERTGMARKEPS